MTIPPEVYVAMIPPLAKAWRDPSQRFFTSAAVRYVWRNSSPTGRAILSGELKGVGYDSRIHNRELDRLLGRLGGGK